MHSYCNLDIVFYWKFMALMQNFIEGEIIKYEREQTFIDIYLFVGKIIRFKNSSPVKYFFFCLSLFTISLCTCIFIVNKEKSQFRWGKNRLINVEWKIQNFLCFIDNQVHLFIKPKLDTTDIVWLNYYGSFFVVGCFLKLWTLLTNYGPISM